MIVEYLNPNWLKNEEEKLKLYELIIKTIAENKEEIIKEMFPNNDNDIFFSLFQKNLKINSKFDYILFFEFKLNFISKNQIKY